MSAKYGQKFIGMTWAAVALLLIGSIQSLALTFVDHERQGNALPDEPAIEKGG